MEIRQATVDAWGWPAFDLYCPDPGLHPWAPANTARAIPRIVGASQMQAGIEEGGTDHRSEDQSSTVQ